MASTLWVQGRGSFIFPTEAQPRPEGGASTVRRRPCDKGARSRTRRDDAGGPRCSGRHRERGPRVQQAAGYVRQRAACCEASTSDIGARTEGGTSEPKSRIKVGISELKARTEDGVSELEARTEDGIAELKARTEDGTSELRARTEDGTSELKARTEDGASEQKARTNDGTSRGEATAAGQSVSTSGREASSGGPDQGLKELCVVGGGLGAVSKEVGGASRGMLRRQMLVTSAAAAAALRDLEAEAMAPPDSGRATAPGGMMVPGGLMLADAGLPAEEPNSLSLAEPASEDTVLVADYLRPGPYQVASLIRQEHTCASCFPQCVDSGCLLRIRVTYPARGPAGLSPFPLAIFSGGYLVSYDQYQSYADRLASWGYVVLTYNKAEGLTVPLDDELSARFISELIDWADASRTLDRIVDASNVYLCGHSRGGKVSVIAAAADPRVLALCLIDPVDNTVYAPLAPGYPSAVAMLREGRDRLASDKGGHSPNDTLGAVPAAGAWWGAGRPVRLPVAVVGGSVSGDCAPVEANYRRFFNSASAPSWEVVVGAGHFQFVDSASLLQNALCGQGRVSDGLVHEVAFGVMVTWAELMVRGNRTGVAVAPPEAPGPLVGAAGGDSSRRVWGLTQAVRGTVANMKQLTKVTSQLKL